MNLPFGCLGAGRRGSWNLFRIDLVTIGLISYLLQLSSREGDRRIVEATRDTLGVARHQRHILRADRFVRGRLGQCRRVLVIGLPESVWNRFVISSK